MKSQIQNKKNGGIVELLVPTLNNRPNLSAKVSLEHYVLLNML